MKMVNTYIEITEAVLIHCNVVNTSYQENSRVWSIIKYFAQTLLFLETLGSEFAYIEVCFTDQNPKPL